VQEKTRKLQEEITIFRHQVEDVWFVEAHQWVWKWPVTV